MSHNRITSRFARKRREVLVADHQRLRTLFWPVARMLRYGIFEMKNFESSERPERFSLETKGENYETNYPDPQERKEVPSR